MAKLLLLFAVLAASVTLTGCGNAGAQKAEAGVQAPDPLKTDPTKPPVPPGLDPATGGKVPPPGKPGTAAAVPSPAGK